MTSTQRWRAPAWELFATRHAAETLADDFAVIASAEQMGPARILHLGIGTGQVSIAIALGKMPEATLAVPTSASGAACVDALASWLEVPVPPRGHRAVADPPPLTVGVIDIGKSKDLGDRHVWQLVQLVFAHDARLYLLWRVAGAEAFLCEHESADRGRVIAELALGLRDGISTRRDTPVPERPYVLFDGHKTNVLAQPWAQKLGMAVTDVATRLETAGRAHVDPLYTQIDRALESWPSDPHAAATRTMKLPVHGCVGTVWSAIVRRGADALNAEDIATLRTKLRSLAVADFVRRLHNTDEVHSLLLR